jgi:L-threonylcarbamoyladenylate synthase
MRNTEVGTDIVKAAAILKEGGLVAIPTETVYGLAANALDAEAVAKIFAAKNRPSFDPLIIHLGDVDHISKYISGNSELLIEIGRKFWPGPLTLLLPKNELIPDIVTSGLDKVAVRIPKHPLTEALLSLLDFPIAAPSANPFGYVSPTTAAHVYDQLSGKVDYILDGGACTVGVESTIIGVEDSDLVVYRKGGLPIEILKANYHGKVRINDFSDSNPSAPGMLKRHYSPDKRVILWDKLLPEEYSDKVAFLRYKSPIKGQKYQFILSENGSLEEAASRLFLGLRELDKMPVTTVAIEFVPDEGLGLAINDRLRRTLAEE